MRQKWLLGELSESQAKSSKSNELTRFSRDRSIPETGGQCDFRVVRSWNLSLTSFDSFHYDGAVIGKFRFVDSIQPIYHAGRSRNSRLQSFRITTTENLWTVPTNQDIQCADCMHAASKSVTDTEHSSPSRALSFKVLLKSQRAVVLQGPTVQVIDFATLTAEISGDPIMTTETHALPYKRAGIAKQVWIAPRIHVLSINAAEGAMAGPKCDKHGSLSATNGNDKCIGTPQKP
jgi:hypothetical protein